MRGLWGLYLSAAVVACSSSDPTPANNAGSTSSAGTSSAGTSNAGGSNSGSVSSTDALSEPNTVCYQIGDEPEICSTEVSAILRDSPDPDLPNASATQFEITIGTADTWTINGRPGPDGVPGPPDEPNVRTFPYGQFECEWTAAADPSCTDTMPGAAVATCTSEASVSIADSRVHALDDQSVVLTYQTFLRGDGDCDEPCSLDDVCKVFPEGNLSPVIAELRIRANVSF